MANASGRAFALPHSIKRDEKLNKLKLGSLFDGIGGFPYSGSKFGIEPVWASEIEPWPIKVTEKHFPDMKHLGDITQINGAEIEPVDVITFGSPCTRLSVAGRHDGFDITFKCEGNNNQPHDCYKNTIRATDKYQYLYKDTCPICGKELCETNESALFFHAIRIIKEMRCATNGAYPRFIVWENVPGAFSSNKGEDFRAVLEEITEAEIPMPRGGKWATAGMVRTEQVDVAWRTLDAQHWGVPQRRRRIFLVADFGGFSASEILFESESLRGDPAESGEEGQETAGDTRDGAKESNQSIAYSFDSLSSNSMKSSNPYSGCREVTVAKCIDTTNPCPSKNQGGIGILQPSRINCTPEGITGTVSSKWAKGTGGPSGDECQNLVVVPAIAIDSNCQDSRFKITGGIVPTLPAKMGTGGNNGPMLLAFNGREDPVSGQVAGALGSSLPQAQCIAYPEPANTLLSKANMSFRDDQDNIVVVNTLTSRMDGSPCVDRGPQMIIQNYTVRRLTPLECLRLQGYPDWWLDIDGMSDTAKYKAIGNSIAVPCVDYVMSGIAEIFQTQSTA